MTRPPQALRSPPQSIEAEQRLLGSLAIGEGDADDVMALISVDDLWRDTHQILYRAICDIQNSGGRVEPFAIEIELKRRDEWDRFGGCNAMVDITSQSTTESLVYLAEIVRHKSVMRQLIAVAREISEEAYGEQDTSDAILERAEKRIFAIGGKRSRGELTTLGDAMAGELERMRKQKNGEVIGIASPFPALDEFTGGFQDTNLIIVAARPGKGKSTLALGFAEYCALDSGVPALFVSEEMSHSELGGRSLSSRARVDHQRIRSGQFLTGDQWEKLERATREAQAAGNFWIDDSGGRTVTQIGAMARRLIAKHGLRIIIVDYLQLLESDGQGRENRQEQVARISKGLKRLAMSLKVPVVALSQLNRQVENREEGRPRLSDLRESGAIENDANMVLMLHQPDKNVNMVECIIEKNRNGPTGVVNLTFQKHLMRFDNYAPEPDFDRGQAY